MLSTLASAVDEVEIPVDGEVIAEMYFLIDRLQAKVTEAVGEFDKAMLWELDGATSITAWLRHHAKLSQARAATTVRTAARLRTMPVTAAAWRDGELCAGQVDAVVANVTTRTAPIFAEHEAELVPSLASLSVHETGIAMERWRARAEAITDDDEDEEPRRSLHLSKTLDGRGELRGSFDAEAHDIVANALRLSMSPDAEGEVRVAAEKRADAFVDLCRWFLDHQGVAPGNRNRPHLNVVLSIEELEARVANGAELAGGGVLDTTGLRRLLCDAAVCRLVTKGTSQILDMGRRTRTISEAIWNALCLRDRTCRWPGCDRPPHWCEAHHAVPWEAGGETNLTNLVLLCSRHHHLGHRPGWSQKLQPDGVLEVTMPDGRILTSHPPGVLRL